MSFRPIVPKAPVLNIDSILTKFGRDIQPIRLVDISQEITQLFILKLDFRPIAPMTAI